MKLRNRKADGPALDLAMAQVIATTEKLQQCRLSQSGPTDVRDDCIAAEAAIDTAIGIAFCAGATQVPVLRRLRARRELLLLTGLSAAGVDVPTCAQPASLAADGPVIAGVDFEREAPVPGHAHGLDLAAALDPGPHLPPARTAHRHPEEAAAPSADLQKGSSLAPTIVYGDFSSLHCYLASILTDTLAGTGTAVEWRAVQHHPRLAFPGLRLDDAAQKCLAAEWWEAQSLLSEDLTVPYRPRTFIPNTQAAVAGYAEANDAGVGDEVRRLLFNAYWTDGSDIGDPEVLRRLLAAPLRRGNSAAQPVAQSGYAVTLAHGPVTSGAHRQIQAWNESWHAPGIRNGSQLIVLDRAGQVFTGRKALLVLVGAERAVAASEPARAFLSLRSGVGEAVCARCGSPQHACSQE